jgi:Protein of unknown function (DUF4058)
MPIHDSTLVDAGIFHYFHQRWIGAICDVLNEGVLPEDYYTLAELRTTFTVESDAEIYLRKQTQVVVRRVSDDRIVALVEVISPGNKSSKFAFDDFLDKVFELLRARVHLLLLDLLPRTKRDPRGIHGAIWEAITEERVTTPKKQSLTLVAYESGDTTRGFYEPVSVGQLLPKMPLFLEYGWHVMIPLEATYAEAFRKVPARWRRVIEGAAK